jgi:ligand-binding sensor domain-containing protein
VQGNTHLQKNTGSEAGISEANDTAISYGPLDIVQCALQDKSGNLWFCTTGGRGIFRKKGNWFTNYTIKDGLCNNEVGSVLEDKNGNLWFGTNDGASRYDGKTFTSVPVPGNAGDPASNRFRSTNEVTGILQDKTGNFWFGTLSHGIYRYDGKSFTRFLPSEVIKCISEDKTGNIWVGSWSNGGAYYYDGAAADILKEHDQEIAKPPAGFTRQDGLTDVMISCMLEDKSGNTWFGTRDNGLCRYDGKPFTYFSEKDGLCNNNVSCILQDKAGNIWIGSPVKAGTKPGGVCRYDGKSFTNFTMKEGLENNDIFCSVEDKAGNLWFGGRYGRLYCYDGKSFIDFSKEVHRQ